MTTPRAALHVAHESEGGAAGKLSELAREKDPLRRLEAELQSVDGGRGEVEHLYEKTWGLLEEAWGLMTECMVMRDGLLDACREIERTMDTVHSRLEALSALEPGVSERLPATHERLGGREQSPAAGSGGVSGSDDTLAR